MSKGVTLKDIYEVANRIEDRLEKIEVRVSSIEIWKAEVVGKMTVVMSLLSIFLVTVWDWTKKKIGL